MKTFANFNVITALAFIKGDRHVLHLQYPKDKEIEIFQILNELESGNQVFKILRVHNNRVLPHPHYFEKKGEERNSDKLTRHAAIYVVIVTIIVSNATKYMFTEKELLSFF